MLPTGTAEEPYVTFVRIPFWVAQLVVLADPRVTREPPGALAERSGAERALSRSKRRRVGAVSARLEDVQKVLTARNAGMPEFTWDLRLNVTGSSRTSVWCLPASAIRLLLWSLYFSPGHARMIS